MSTDGIGGLHQGGVDGLVMGFLCRTLGWATIKWTRRTPQFIARFFIAPFAICNLIANYVDPGPWWLNIANVLAVGWIGFQIGRRSVLLEAMNSPTPPLWALYVAMGTMRFRQPVLWLGLGATIGNCVFEDWNAMWWSGAWLSFYVCLFMLTMFRPFTRPKKPKRVRARRSFRLPTLVPRLGGLGA